MNSERLIALIDSLGEAERRKYVVFSELTGIKKDTLKNLCRGQQRFNDEHLEAISKAYPQYKIWFAFGETYPELGQISPELEETVSEYGRAGTDTD